MQLNTNFTVPEWAQTAKTESISALTDLTKSNSASAFATPVENVNQQQSVCENNYALVKGAIDKILKTPSVTTKDTMNIIESSQRIHLQLIRLRSKLSKVLNKGYSLKRRIAEHQARELIRGIAFRSTIKIQDKRFCRSRTLDKLVDIKPSFTIYLYPTYFKLSNCEEAFTYNGPMSKILEYVRDEILLPEVMDILDDSNCTFYDGGIIVEVHDRRARIRPSTFASQVNTPVDQAFGALPFSPQHYDIYRVFLKPTHLSLIEDLRNMNANNPTSKGQLSEHHLLELESNILLCTEKNVCLDPCPYVGRIASILEYNRLKFNIKPKRKPNTSQEPILLASETVEQDVLAYLNPYEIKREVHQNFDQMSFTEQWRLSKASQDSTPTSALDLVSGELVSTNQIIRSLKFTKKVRDSPEPKILYTSINFYLRQSGSVEVFLRIGNQTDTSINGQSLKFTFPDIETSDVYAKNFTAYYTKCEGHILSSDSKGGSEFAQLHGSSQSRSKKTTPAPSSINLLNTGMNETGIHQMMRQNSNLGTSSSQKNPDSPTSVAASSVIDFPISQQSTNSVKPSVGGSLHLQQRLQNVENQLNLQLQKSQMKTYMPDNSMTHQPSMTPPQPQVVMSNFSPNNSSSSLNIPSNSRPNLTSEQIQMLMSMNFNQVPENYRQLYLAIKQRMQQQQQQQTPQQHQQQQQPQSNRSTMSQNSSGGISQDLSQMLSQSINRTQHMNQIQTPQQVRTSQNVQQYQQQLLRQQQSRMLQLSAQNSMAGNNSQFQQLATQLNPGMNNVRLNLQQMNQLNQIQQMNQLLLQQQQQQVQQGFINENALRAAGINPVVFSQMMRPQNTGNMTSNRLNMLLANQLRSQQQQSGSNFQLPPQ